MSRKEDVQNLIATHSRRLQKLKEKKAKKGINIETETEIEIEDIEEELIELRGELADIIEKENLDKAPAVYIANLKDAPDPARLSTNTKLIDWSAKFIAQPRKVPEQDEWQDVLLPELLSLPTEVGNAELVRLQGSSALSTAFAFGQIFKQIGRYRLAVDQYALSGTQTWFSDAWPDEGDAVPKFEKYMVVGEEQASDGVVIVYAAPQTTLMNMVTEVGTHRKEGKAFNEILNQTYTPQYCAGVLVLEAKTASGEKHLTGLEAACLARTSRRMVMDFIREVNPDKLHLYLAGPYGLAAFLGHHWNVVGKEIQCYERLGHSQYVPSLNLG